MAEHLAKPQALPIGPVLKSVADGEEWHHWEQGLGMHGSLIFPLPPRVLYRSWCQL